MNLYEYQQKAARTMNPETTVTEELAVLALGMVGEFGEVLELIMKPLPQEEMKQEMKSELGDISWYTANLYNHLESEWTTERHVPLLKKVISSFDLERLIVTGLLNATKLADIVKKTVGHGHELPTSKILGMLEDITTYIQVIASKFDLTHQEILDYNVNEKLVKRYPDGFSAERSINR